MTAMGNRQSSLFRASMTMNAVLSVVGKDTVGILASVASKCSEYQANVIDVSQTVINEYFAMFMFINIDKLTIEFNDFVDE